MEGGRGRRWMEVVKREDGQGRKREKMERRGGRTCKRRTEKKEEEDRGRR